MSNCVEGYVYDDFSIDEFIHASEDDEEEKVYHPSALSKLAAGTIVKHSHLTLQGLRSLPKTFAPLLLLAALEEGQSRWSTPNLKVLPPSAHAIFHQWPLEVIRFKDLLPALSKDRRVETAFSLITFNHLFHRSPKHKLRCLDLTSYPVIGQEDVKMMYEDYPYELLRPEQRFFAPLYKALQDSEAFKKIQHMKFKEKLVEHLRRKTDGWVTGMGDGSTGRGGPPLEVVFDMIEFQAHKHAQSTFLMDFTLVSCLRYFTPITFSVNKLRIRGSPFAFEFPHPSFQNSAVGQEVLEAVNAMPKERVEGICLQWLPKKMLLDYSRVLKQFSNVKSVAVRECMLRAESQQKSGSSQDQLLHNLSQLLTGYQHLQRLELYSLNLQGRLGDLLNSVQSRLDYLSLECSSLLDEDLVLLSTSSQLLTLKELHLRDICRYLYYVRNEEAVPLSSNTGEEPPSDMALLQVISSLRHSQNLLVLNISKNLISADHYRQICVMMPEFQSLRCLYINDIIVDMKLCMNLIEACIQVSTLQGIKVSARNIYRPEDPRSGREAREELINMVWELKEEKSRMDFKVEIPKGQEYDIFVSHLGRGGPLNSGGV